MILHPKALKIDQLLKSDVLPQSSDGLLITKVIQLSKSSQQAQSISRLLGKTKLCSDDQDK